MGFKVYVSDELETSIEACKSRLNKHQWVRKAILDKLECEPCEYEIQYPNDDRQSVMSEDLPCKGDSDGI